MESQSKESEQKSTSTGGFSKLVKGYSKVIDPVAKYGGAFGATALGIMMFLTVFDVLGRFIGGFDFVRNITTFFKPIPGTTEITEYLMIILTCFALGYMALHKGHIRVDLVLQYTSKKVSRWIDVYTFGLSSLLYGLITWQAWFEFASFYNNKLTSAVLSIPSYPFAFLIIIGAAICTLVLFRDFLKSIEEVTK